MIEMKYIDDLNLEWPSNERDSSTIAPIVLSLIQSGYKCLTGELFKYLQYILIYRPNVLLIYNFTGAVINNDFTVLEKYSFSKVVLLSSLSKNSC